MIKKRAFILFIILAFCAENGLAEKKNSGVKKRTAAKELEGDDFDDLEDRMDKLEGEMEIMREQHKMMIHRTNVGFLDQFYGRVGATIIMPRSRTFPFRADSGLGVFAGIGNYFGRHSVLDFSIDWDIYPAFNLQFRYEFHNDAPQITWGPVIGVKVKFADIKPFDDFLDKPEQVKPLFMEVGGIIGFPLSRSLLTLQLLYLTNQQGILVANLGMHFFF